MMRRIRLAVVIPFFLGIFLGTMITSFLTMTVQSIDEELPQHREVVSEVELREENSPDDPENIEEAPSFLPSRLASYNVLTSTAAVREQSFAIHRTWGGEKAIKESIEYYVYPRAGREEIDFATFRKMPITSLEFEQEEADRRASAGTFKLWRNICDKKQEDYLWFVKVQDDVYLKRMQLGRLLSSLNSSEPLFVGKSVFPSGRERDDLGLRNGESYCHATCYALSQKALKMLCPKLESCQENAGSTNEDVEIARCLRTHYKINCTAATEVEYNIIA